MPIYSPVQGSRALIQPVPRDSRCVLALQIIRRMGTHGVEDAGAAQAMMAAFGTNWRKSWLLAQTMMLDLSRMATQPITIAPCCCGRMTTDEAQLLRIIGCSTNDPARALHLLGDITGARAVHGLMATITSFAEALFEGV